MDLSLAHLRRTSRELLDTIKLLVSTRRTNSERVYDVLGEHNSLGTQSLFLNLGYWRDTDDYDEACATLAHVLGESVEMGSDDDVVDVGFGFGDQDAYWLKTFSPRAISAFNVTRSQIEIATKRFTDDRLDFRFGSATALPRGDETADKLTALECAFHFPTRDMFFDEAFRVLKPGGRIGVADVLPMTAHSSIKRRIMFAAARAFWQIPAANWYTADEYPAHLERAGFVDIKVTSIREDVYPGLYLYLKTGTADVSRRWNPFFRIIRKLSDRGWGAFDYVIATARKP